MLDQITPLILTRNEAPNIGRTLERLSWAREVVVVDSLSEDETVSIIRRFPRVRIHEREFDRHSDQWNFGLRETGIRSEWVLALDADYILTEDFTMELAGLKPGPEVDGYAARFIYWIHGRPLRGSVYPPVTVLFRKDKVLYHQDGHTQRVVVEGKTCHLKSPLIHDDRKSFNHWLRSQQRYAAIEADKLLGASFSELDWVDRVRRMKIALPPLVFFYCLFVKGLILDGKAGLYYSFQRMCAESLLSFYLIRGGPGNEPAQNGHPWR